jgi:hypothetical protein
MEVATFVLYTAVRLGGLYRLLRERSLAMIEA